MNDCKVKWENILIFPELINNLDLRTLAEVSLVSILVRAKLKPTIFKRIKFNTIDFTRYMDNVNNLIWVYFFEKYGFMSRVSNLEAPDKSTYKELKLDSTINEFESTLAEVKQLVKVCNFYDIGKAGYYMLPMFSLFENLTTLKLQNSLVSLKAFCKLSKCLKCLESIEFIRITFIKTLSEELQHIDIKFPVNLKKLTFIVVGINSVQSISPYNFLFDKNDTRASEDFSLFPISIPSLKCFTYSQGGYRDSGLNQFLAGNPQLECLSINTNTIDQYKADYFSNLKKLIIEDNYIDGDITLTNIDSIEELEFKFLERNLFHFIQKLCLMSVNLNRLTFMLDINEETMPRLLNFVENIVSNCNRLKVLKLNIIDKCDDPIKLSNLNNVELLIICSHLNNLILFDFNCINNLKRVEFHYHRTLINKGSVKDKLLSIKNWKFRFLDKCVKGYKIK
ncbi:hypothetical protein CONCODRAFT_19948 [Conidiobolus coronatus NRRL 28638]|uniref:RNI-like protein n=1 Tax=Conidiobolus coronatus (strain ATCC 28846 / CBS 209.66 / NRRL 28638) TaxID=796925 RepID=A0A137NVU9_CONC2|nr:hypothetical protein CONCODRAFT_19948 [Conidiobolus coronatus NRRL 28638]|eukprot:KXN66933.1 hypothetical protein CONCODRAFT_19948 [Conidiobolus coronatus NRRL 28638]